MTTFFVVHGYSSPDRNTGKWNDPVLVLTRCATEADVIALKAKHEADLNEETLNQTFIVIEGTERQVAVGRLLAEMISHGDRVVVLTGRNKSCKGTVGWTDEEGAGVVIDAGAPLDNGGQASWHLWDEIARLDDESSVVSIKPTTTCKVAIDRLAEFDDNIEKS